MNIPSNQGLISIYGNQEIVRRAKGSWTDSKAIHNINEVGAQALRQGSRYLRLQLNVSYVFFTALSYIKRREGVFRLRLKNGSSGFTHNNAIEER
jgi:hypothetical protein